jgi:hypothetical protein
MKLVGFNNMALRVNAEVLEVDRQLKDLSTFTEDYLHDLTHGDIQKKTQEFIQKNETKNAN